MTECIQGEHRQQSTLLPERLEDYFADDNPVRVVDVFIDELKLSQPGFQTTSQTTPAAIRRRRSKAMFTGI